LEAGRPLRTAEKLDGVLVQRLRCLQDNDFGRTEC